MRFKTLDSYNFANKSVLVRIDINSEIDNGKVISSPRFSEAAKTLKELVKKKAKVVVLAHQGRPGKPDFIGLSQHAKILSKYLKIKYVDDVVGVNAVKAIKSLKPGQCLLLGNVRALKEEFNPGKNKLTATLRPLFDYYVNDAFSICHRKQTSVVSFPKFLKSCIGKTLENELKHIEKLKMKDCLYILGGAKPTDVMLLLNKKNILSTGVLANLCLMAKKVNLGADNEVVVDYPEAMNEILKNLKHIKTPVDVAVDENGKRKELDIKELPSNYHILDLGKNTAKEYIKEIKKAKKIFFKGTAGFAEKKEFAFGTKTLLKAVESSKAFSVISGGHSITALKKFGINQKKLGYVSLSGGALVHYLAGKKLPGLEVLE